MPSSLVKFSFIVTRLEGANTAKLTGLAENLQERAMSLKGEAKTALKKIASPVDGLPPAVFQNTPRMLMGDGTWNHLRFPLATDSAVTVSATAAERLFQDVVTTVAPVGTIAALTAANARVVHDDVDTAVGLHALVEQRDDLLVLKSDPKTFHRL